MTIPVTLRRREAALHQPCAWFVAGDDPHLWLEEAASWPCALEGVRFLTVATPDGSRPGGALLVPSEPVAVRGTGRGHPYGLIGKNLYLPIDAVIDPPLSPEEIGAMTGDEIAVWHPSLGMTSFARTDERFAWDLLCAPDFGTEMWNIARSGPSARAGLHGVKLAVTLKLEDLFGPENADIASESPDVLPPSVDEPGHGLPARLARTAAGALFKAIMQLTRHVPRTAAAPTWINALENWAGRYLSGINVNLEHIRHRELRRLLDLLERSPIDGLRHAISLSALAHRGRAKPSGRLGQRNLDFSLSRLGGHHASDAWDVPVDIQNALAQKYRDLASREMKLGRHRRAACIYAELLGDFPSAASALKVGRHFREAAVLYQERLNDPMAAAECLARGGLWHEALALYEKGGHWLPAADLYARIGDTQSERACVRREVERLVASRMTVAAARLIDTRLDGTDEALTLLESEWPDGPQAVAALEEQNILLERHRRHQELETRISQHAQQRTPPALIAGLCSTMAQLVRTSPHAGVRQAATDLVRVKAADALHGRGLGSADELRILKSLTQLVPSDRLLARDTLKYRSARVARDRATASKRPGSAKTAIGIQDAGRITLPNDATYSSALGGPNGFFAVGHRRQDTVTMVCGTWGGHLDVLTWPDPAPERQDAFVFEPHNASVLLARPHAQGLDEKSLPRAGVVPAMAGRPTWFPQDTLCASSSRFSVWILRVVGQRVVLDCYHHSRLAGTHDVTDALVGAGATASAGARLSLNALGSHGQVALGYGRHLLTIDNHRDLQVVELPAEIHTLLIAPGRMPGWIALLERGAMHISSQRGLEQTEIDPDIREPLGCFTGDGGLVLVSQGEGRTWHSISGDAKTATLNRFDIPSSDAIAITQGANPDSFAVFTRRGGVLMWRLKPAR